MSIDPDLLKAIADDLKGINEAEEYQRVLKAEPWLKKHLQDSEGYARSKYRQVTEDKNTPERVRVTQTG